MEFYNKPYDRGSPLRRREDDELYEDGIPESVEPSLVERPSVDRYGFIAHEGAILVKDSTLPVEVLRSREVKWLKMMSNWDKWMSKKLKKVKERCRKGIPPSVRQRAWQYLCGSVAMMKENQGVFQNLLSCSSPDWESVIKKDLNRTFPYHEMFSEKDGQGQKDLYDVLRAYTNHRPEVGYCQAMAPIVAVLLMHMPAEESFWCFVAICDNYLKGYFSEKLEAIKTDGQIFGNLLDSVLPSVGKHMRIHKVDPLMYMTEWFMCLFARTLPFATVLRIWDIFFFEGPKVLFRTALTILKLTMTPSALRRCNGLFEINEKLRNLSVEQMQEDVLIPASLQLKISHKELKREHLDIAGRKPTSPSGVT